MFPTNSERLIGISDAVSAFVYGYPSSCPRAHCTPNKSVTTLRYTRRHGHVYIQAMPVGTYRVQSPGFSKIVYSEGTKWQDSVHAPSSVANPDTRCLCFVGLLLKDLARFMSIIRSLYVHHSPGVLWESRWTSWAVRPNEPSRFRGRKDILNHALVLVTACP